MNRRGPGRPVGRSAGDTRGRILSAARAQFAARGYATTSMRSIAAQAGVDASLISHYFGSKEQLLVATMELPIDPLAEISSVVDGGRDALGERLVRTFVTAWDPHRDVFAALLRTTLAAGEPEMPAVQVARDVLVARLRDLLDGDALRASLVAGQVIGLATMRYVLQLPPVAQASVDDVVAAYGPAVQAVVDGA